MSFYVNAQVIFSAFLGFVLLQQSPDQLIIIGYLLICGSGIALFLYHRRQEDCVKR